MVTKQSPALVQLISLGATLESAPIPKQMAARIRQMVLYMALPFYGFVAGKGRRMYHLPATVYFWGCYLL